MVAESSLLRINNHPPQAPLQASLARPRQPRPSPTPAPWDRCGRAPPPCGRPPGRTAAAAAAPAAAVLYYYAMLCYAILYYAMLCHAMPCYAMLYYTISLSLYVYIYIYIHIYTYNHILYMYTHVARPHPGRPPASARASASGRLCGCLLGRAARHRLACSTAAPSSPQSVPQIPIQLLLLDHTVRSTRIRCFNRLPIPFLQTRSLAYAVSTGGTRCVRLPR